MPMQNWRIWLLFYLLIGMMAALFLSRFALSACMIAFFIAAFLHNHWRVHLKKFIQTPLLWGMSILFFLPLISGAWSDDKEQWLQSIQLKLPLLFFPLAFAGPFEFDARQWKWLYYAFIAIISIACGWSLFHYAMDTDAVNKGYLQARSMLTPLGNDHVRFSWLVNAALLLSFWLYRKERKQQAHAAIFYFLLCIAFVVYLHLLAARTGVLSFYISVMMLVLWLLFKKGSARFAIPLLTGMISLPFIAWFLFPSFQNRVKYMKYDFSFFSHAAYQPSTTDAVRVISMKAGAELMFENPVKGVGFGDLPVETNSWYELHYSHVQASDRILPSSEWLIYGAACGIAGALLFTVCMLIPFTVRSENKLLWSILNLTAAFSFIADIGLEVQFGVFIYCFMVLWWWKWFTPQNH